MVAGAVLAAILAVEPGAVPPTSPAATTALEAATRWISALRRVNGEALEAMTGWPFRYTLSRHAHLVGRLRPDTKPIRDSHEFCPSLASDGPSLAKWLKCMCVYDSEVIGGLRHARSGKGPLPDDVELPGTTMVVHPARRRGKPFTWVTAGYELGYGADETIRIDVGVSGDDSSAFRVRELRVRVDHSYSQKSLDDAARLWREQAAKHHIK
jgi:hypothetical protein